MSEPINDGGPAFPRVAADPSWGNGTESFEGMTLRDYFAAKALSGDFAAQNEEAGFFENNCSDTTISERCELYYRFADAMIAERSKAK